MAVSNAPLEMAYPPCAGWGWRVTMEATITTEPPPRARMAGSAARVIWSEPNRLVSMILRQMARSTSSKLWKASKRKALLTSTSMPPNSSTPAAIRRAHASGSVMSVGTVMARAPMSDTSARTSSRVDWRRAARTRSAPWAASALAAWRPSPGPTPETTQTLPDSKPARADADSSLFTVVMGAA